MTRLNLSSDTWAWARLLRDLRTLPRLHRRLVQQPSRLQRSANGLSLTTNLPGSVHCASRTASPSNTDSGQALISSSSTSAPPRDSFKSIKISVCYSLFSGSFFLDVTAVKTKFYPRIIAGEIGFTMDPLESNTVARWADISQHTSFPEYSISSFLAD